MREFARGLRKRQTDAETLLWKHLRGRRFAGIKFKRQVPISGFVVDFVALDQKLIVEVDGGQHAERATRDDNRSVVLEKCGYQVVRFWNHDVLSNIDGVLEAILQEINISR